MNNVSQAISDRAYITFKNDAAYLNLIMILVPLMNFLSGIVIDLYAPSMPEIAIYYHTSIMMVKNTITTTMIGFAIGCLLCGVLFDTWGRRKIIITALILFIISNLLAPCCHTIYQLLAIRFVQGLMASAMSIGCRALVSDHFTGHRFVVAVLYGSFAYGVGPVVGPFFGGYLQYHFGWQANFYAYAFFGALMLVLFTLFVQERFQKVAGFTLIKALAFYKTVTTHKTFLYGAFILGLIYLELILYPTLGPFLVEHQLNDTAITYGNSALIVGLGYLGGSMSNRFLLKFLSQAQLINVGFIILGISVLAQLLFSLFIGLNLWTLVLPITLIGYAVGFMYGNIMSICLKIFPDNVGIGSASLIFFLTLFTAIGVFALSSLKITTLYQLFLLCFGIIFVHLLVYGCLFRKNIDLKI